MRRDRVTGIAALPVTAGAFRISDLHYCALPDRSGAAADRGAAWRHDYLALREAVAGSPIVTYNPDFVRQMILRTCRVNRLAAFDGEWIDLAAAAALVGSEHGELTTMGYWLERMRSGGRSPHDAAYDVFAMAQLLEAVLAYAADAGMETVESLVHRQDVRASLGGQ